MKWNQNKYIILTFLSIVALIICSFYQYFNENYSYAKYYYEIKETCKTKEDQTKDICSYFKNEQQLKSYLEINDPKQKFESLDAITLTCSIVETTVFSLLQLLSPLLIIIAIVGSVHGYFTSGMFQNQLQRMSYRNYLKKMYRPAFKAALMIPLSLLLIFLLAMIITKFNFHINEEVTWLAVYEPWKYEHFLFYGGIILITQFLISLLYANLALIACKRNKNKIVTIIMAYLFFILTSLLIYIGIYHLFLNVLLGFHNLTELFNINGYFFFNIGPNCQYVVLLAFLFQLISFLILYFTYRKKEEVIMSYEKQSGE